MSAIVLGLDHLRLNDDTTKPCKETMNMEDKYNIAFDYKQVHIA